MYYGAHGRGDLASAAAAVAVAAEGLILCKSGAAWGPVGVVGAPAGVVGAVSAWAPGSESSQPRGSIIEGGGGAGQEDYWGSGVRALSWALRFSMASSLSKIWSNKW